MNTGMDPILGSAAALPTVPRGYDASPGEPQAPADFERVAVIVHHGMGQQVPYETIEGVAQAIWSQGEHPERPVVRYARLGVSGNNDIEPELVRAELRLERNFDGVIRKFDVHIYESYWAPLTEGQVTIKDVISFLRRAGLNGFWNTTNGTFQRRLFGSECEFNLPKARLMATLLGLLLLITALVFINSVLTAAAASHAIGSHSPFPSGNMLAALTWDMLLLDIAAVAIFLGIVVGGVPSVRSLKNNTKSFIRNVTTRLGWILIYSGATVILFAAMLMAFVHLPGLMWPLSYDPAAGWNRWVNEHSIMVFLLWALELSAAYAVRWALIEYVGDVVAYIAAYSVSKFWKLRQEIRDAGMKVTRAVYRAENPSGEDFLYNKIVVVGHSLGSVISYDVLNSLLLEAARSDRPLNVAQRTRMFVTFGSPLDKTAFLFRTLKDMYSEVREVGAAAVQPMIADYDCRPQEWINLWSKADIISGALDYYDRPHENNAKNLSQAEDLAKVPAIERAKRVKNVEDPEARTPLKAHVEYWRGSLLATTLWQGITE